MRVLALGLAHSQQAMQAERAVTDMTNDLLKKNAEALKTVSYTHLDVYKRQASASWL